jgi:arylsulfatase
MNRVIAISTSLLIWATVGLAQYSPERKTAPKFSGKIGVAKDEAQKYQPDYQIKAPAGAPNIVLIMLDDVGFSTASTFGGLAQTPTFDKLADKGLKYTNFHTTGLCAPSRSALLTGRNHHSVHMGHFTETAFDAPGYDGHMPFEKATIAEVLRENGYNTFAVGKWHLTPVAERTPAGPFNRWPTGRGFDYFYGFHESATNQYYPVLWEGNNRAPIDTALGRHLNTYLADRAIQYIGNQKAANSAKPFFLYLTPGATHSPMQVDKAWIDKYKGVFDEGWDKYRETVLINQKKLGIVPENLKLPPRNERIKAWNTLSADEKKLMARSMEAHAGFLSQTDYEIGRIIDFIKQIGQLDNTLVFVIIGDNGATKFTQETPGLAPADEHLQGEARIKAALKNYDAIGTKKLDGDIPLGWTQASNTPFKLWKADANAEGGTHNPLIVSYPKLIQQKEQGRLRRQYTHLIDIWPTILEITGAKVPASINGYLQAPIEGISFAYSLNDATAKSRHTMQYFENGGSRALYKDGWKAAAYHKPGGAFADDVWELYRMETDFNEQIDFAPNYPTKLAELRALFEVEAKKYNIYPLVESWFPATKGLQISDSRDTPEAAKKSISGH